MTDTTHTPGPWRVLHKRGVFLMDTETLAIGMADRHRKEHVANARLMAAAPDMLAALQEVLPLAENWGHPDHPGIVAARTAIARATGGRA